MNIYTRAGTLIGNVTPIDATPTEDSTNAVQSGGVYDAIADMPVGGDSVIVKSPKNLIDKSTTVHGSLNTTTGEVTQSETYYVTDFIPVDLSVTYLVTQCSRACAYDDSKTFISTIINYAPLGIPSGASYVRLRIDPNGLDVAVLCDKDHYTDGVYDGFDTDGFTDDFYNATNKGLSEYAKASDQFVTGVNLFDCEHDYVQVTTRAVGGGVKSDGAFEYKTDTITNDSEFTTNVNIASDKFFPVAEGQMVVCNKQADVVAFYTANKTYISNRQNRAPYHASLAPVDCAYARFQIHGTNDTTQGDGVITSLSQIKDIIIWTVDAVGDNDYVPNLPYSKIPYQLDGDCVSNDYLDKVIPNMVESPFLSAMRCMAIREVNKRDYAWRFGNLNMWIMAGIGGWNMTKKMLMDYGVDFCGFEECTINQSTNHYKGIAEFLHGWQFPSGFYTNWSDGEDAIDKSFASRFDVTESTKLLFTSTSSNASYLNCKVQLPRYMDVYDSKRILSVYVVHFAITNAETKVAIATELLGQIATDDSDFIVILGDTNDFGDTDETKHYWATLEAGGFRPVIPLDSNNKTITQDGIEQSGDEYPEKQWRKKCIDQFLVSDNIEMVTYGVVNTKDEYAVDSIKGVGTNNEPALSDHDFVYVDLKFDYSTPRTIIPIE